MGHKLYNSNGKEIRNLDLQNKIEWCRKGENLEEAFLRTYGDRFDLKLNPNKISDPTVPDFLHKPTNRVADLKTQNTPFFLAHKSFRLDPQYAVTFNKIDLERYTALYPEILIYFSVNWLATTIKFDSGHSISVEPMSGVWGINLKNLSLLCTADNLHEYKQRINDKNGNAQFSYVVDLRAKGFKRLTND